MKAFLVVLAVVVGVAVASPAGHGGMVLFKYNISKCTKMVVFYAKAG